MARVGTAAEQDSFARDGGDVGTRLPSLDSRLSRLARDSRTLLLDGAMGTELDRRGVTGRCACSLTAPEAVLAVHVEYIRAGSEAIITNTLTMNRIFISTHRLPIDAAAVNRAAAGLARRAMAGRGYVLGNLSSTGLLLEPYGELSERELMACYREQAASLAEGGVDGFIIETMMDPREAVCALRACLDAARLPVLACIAFDSSRGGGRTVMGSSAEECARALEREGASAVGANCGSLDPLEMAVYISVTSTSIVCLSPDWRKVLETGGITYDQFVADYLRFISNAIDKPGVAKKTEATESIAKKTRRKKRA